MKFVIILCLFVVHVAAETEEIAGGSPGTGVLTDREGTTWINLSHPIKIILK